MVCIYCGHFTKVSNSRLQKKANQVWRRRKCQGCGAVFTTLESVDATQALRVHRQKHFQPFSRDKLLLSLYDSLRHRKTAMVDATALTATVLSQLYPLITNATLERDSIAEVAAAVLGRFDTAAATSYRAFHPVG
jgi:transcriptional repressor NrdR